MLTTSTLDLANKDDANLIAQSMEHPIVRMLGDTQFIIAHDLPSVGANWKAFIPKMDHSDERITIRSRKWERFPVIDHGISGSASTFEIGTIGQGEAHLYLCHGELGSSCDFSVWPPTDKSLTYYDVVFYVEDGKLYTLPEDKFLMN